MASSLECGAVLDLSKKSPAHTPMKPEADRGSSPGSAMSHESRSYESSALINTPPHESEASGSKVNQAMFTMPSQFCPSMELSSYPRIVPETQKAAVHLDGRVGAMMPPTFMPFQPIGSAGPLQRPTNIGFNYPLQPVVPMSISSPTDSMASSPPAGPSQTTPKCSQTKRPSRPFKVYPSVPAFGNDNIDRILNELTDECYEEYRDKVLQNVERSSSKGTNAKMRRDNVHKLCMPTSTMQDKDEAYLEKRKKNNAAAKRSRDARKRKEDEIAIRAAYLESRIVWLMQMVKKLQSENDRLRRYEDVVQKLNVNLQSYL